jgi:hypothetical protein
MNTEQLVAMQSVIDFDSLNITINDGRVYNEKGEFAIILSPGYGAGWSTWGADVFDPLAVVMLLLGDNDVSHYNHYADKFYPDREYRCSLGLDDAEVLWLSPGTQFRIDEYDGNESIVFRDDDSIWSK